MIAATVFDICFLAPLYAFLAIAAIIGIIVFGVWALSVLEQLFVKPKKPDPNEIKPIYCPKCGEVVHLSVSAIDAAKTANVVIRCSCGNIVKPKGRS